MKQRTIWEITGLVVLVTVHFFWLTSLLGRNCVLFLVFSNSLIYNLFLFFFLLSKEYLSPILRISVQPSSDYSCIHKLHMLGNKHSERPQRSSATFVMSYQAYLDINMSYHTHHCSWRPWEPDWAGIYQGSPLKVTLLDSLSLLGSWEGSHFVQHTLRTLRVMLPLLENRVFTLKYWKFFYKGGLPPLSHLFIDSIITLY